MLYTQEQFIDFANYMLKKNGITDQVTHPDRTNWETDNNVQPLQAGQEITIQMVDGINIIAEVSRIETTPTL